MLNSSQLFIENQSNQIDDNFSFNANQVDDANKANWCKQCRTGFHKTFQQLAMFDATNLNLNGNILLIDQKSKFSFFIINNVLNLTYFVL